MYVSLCVTRIPTLSQLGHKCIEVNLYEDRGETTHAIHENMFLPPLKILDGFFLVFYEPIRILSEASELV